jgi:thiol-disulfide isomerase/thioredoxin
MALCCIGGVCIPYSAIIPLIIYGFRWLLQKLDAWGILPSWISSVLSAFLSIEKKNKYPNGSDTTTSCCARENSTADGSLHSLRRRRGKHMKHTTSVASSCSTNGTHGTTETTKTEEEEDDDDDADEGIIYVKDFEQWNRFLMEAAALKTASSSRRHQDKATIVICKFTASWCKPCQKIQPVFESLATQSTMLRFVLIDVEEDDAFQELMSVYGIFTLPTFVAIQVTHQQQQQLSQPTTTNPAPPLPVLLDKYTGSDAEKLTTFVETIAEKGKKTQ